MHNRIVVIGNTGSGKTTLAQKISKKLKIPHIELDALHWGPDWEMPHHDEFREKVKKAISGDRWVVDGNYGKAYDIFWVRADTLVWIDIPLWITFFQLLFRTIRRIITRERLWHNNREHLSEQFLSKNSLILYLFQTHTRRKVEFENRLGKSEFSNLNVFRFKSNKEIDRWVMSLK